MYVYFILVCLYESILVLSTKWKFENRISRHINNLKNAFLIALEPINWMHACMRVCVLLVRFKPDRFISTVSFCASLIATLSEISLFFFQSLCSSSCIGRKVLSIPKLSTWIFFLWFQILNIQT